MSSPGAVVRHRRPAYALAIDARDHQAPPRCVEAARPLVRTVPDGVVVFHVRHLDGPLRQHEPIVAVVNSDIENRLDVEGNGNAGVLDERRLRNARNVDRHLVLDESG